MQKFLSAITCKQGVADLKSNVSPFTNSILGYVMLDIYQPVSKEGRFLQSDVIFVRERAAK